MHANHRENLPDSIGVPSSVLTDGDIKDAVGQGFLINQDEFDEGCLRHSSYELRVGDYEILAPEIDKIGYYRPTDRAGDCVTLRPGESAKVWTLERLDIPANVLGRVAVVGGIFTSGISAGSTFADPGYRGRLYISLSNVTDRVLTLDERCPLARIEFFKLGKPVDQAHPGEEGTRPGFVRPEMPPRVSSDDLKNGQVDEWLDRVGQFADGDRYDERHVILSHVIGRLNERLGASERRADVQALALVAVFALSLAALTPLLWDLLPVKVQDRISVEIVASLVGLVSFAVIVRIRRLGGALMRLIKRVID